MGHVSVGLNNGYCIISLLTHRVLHGDDMKEIDKSIHKIQINNMLNKLAGKLEFVDVGNELTINLTLKVVDHVKA